MTATASQCSTCGGAGTVLDHSEGCMDLECGNGAGPGACAGEEIECPECHPPPPRVCPLSGLRYFTTIKHPDFGWLHTFGGPFDSYTTPERDEHGEWFWRRYDHDEGAWSSDYCEALPADVEAYVERRAAEVCR